MFFRGSGLGAYFYTLAASVYVTYPALFHLFGGLLLRCYQVDNDDHYWYRASVGLLVCFSIGAPPISYPEHMQGQFNVQDTEIENGGFYLLR